MHANLGQRQQCNFSVCGIESVTRPEETNK